MAGEVSEIMPVGTASQRRRTDCQASIMANGTKAHSVVSEINEPVFGQIKQARGFRQFLLRGFEKVRRMSRSRSFNCGSQRSQAGFGLAVGRDRSHWPHVPMQGP
jgi:hypothetical protein